MNYYPFHIGDYASATQHLTLEEDAMYRRLLDICYTTEKPLTKDERQLYRLTRAATDSHREAVLTVLHEFFEETDAGWISRRAMAEIETMQEKQQKQRDKANKRWHKPGAEPGTATAMPQQTSDDAAAGNRDAVAMPPTPVPTPTPVPVVKKPSASSAAKLPTCPTVDLIALYHEILPNLPKAVLPTKDRVKALQRTWEWVLTSVKPDNTRRAETAEQAVAWFRTYFERATENDFLMGRTPRTGEHANWRCDLDFLLTDRGMKHVIEKTMEHA